MPTYQEWIAAQNQGRQAAQRQLPNAQSAVNNARNTLNQTNNPSGLPGGFNSAAFNAASTQFGNANNALDSAQNNLSQFDPNSVDNQAAGNKYQAYDLAHAGVDRLANDPTDQFIRQALQNAARPGAGPYDATTRNAMFTGAMESSGAKAQAQSIMDSAAQRGLSPNDPSVQAALRNAQGQQAQAGQRARLGIDTVANPANYAAQQSAVNRLGDYNSSRQQQQQSAEDRLREMLINEDFHRQVAGPQVSTVGTIGGPATTAQPSSGQSYQDSNPRAPAAMSGQQGGQAAVNAFNRSFNNGTPVNSRSPVSGAGSGWTATGPAGTVTNQTQAPGMWTATGPAGTITGQNPTRLPLQPPQQRLLPGRQGYSDYSS